jgi:hypothetical protein
MYRVARFECCGVCGLECEICGVNWGMEKESKRKKVKNEKRQQKKRKSNLILVLFDVHLI